MVIVPDAVCLRMAAYEDAAALASLVDSEDLRRKLALAGRARVEALYDLPIVAARMDDLFEAALGRRGV